MKERPDIGVYVKDLSAYVVNNADDMDKTMTTGNKNSELWFVLLWKFFSWLGVTSRERKKIFLGFLKAPILSSLTIHNGALRKKRKVVRDMVSGGWYYPIIVFLIRISNEYSKYAITYNPLLRPCRLITCKCYSIGLA